jgi:hypothetical protein
VGELGARILLLFTHDFAAPTKDLLVPVPLLDVLDALFGGKSWVYSHQVKFNSAFANAYVNFTHWIVTKILYLRPEVPDK